MGSSFAATCRNGDWEGPRRGIVLPNPRGGGAGIAGRDGTVDSEGGAGARWERRGGIGGGCCRGREALRDLDLDEERGGTLPGGMLYILE